MSMKSNSVPSGIYRDRLITASGKQLDRGWRSNIIVDNCRDLLGAFMAGNSDVHGVQFIQIGQGDSAWDSNPPAAPAAGTNQLEDLSPFTLAIGSPQFTLEFLNIGNEPVTGPTNRIQITISLEPGSPPIGMGEESYPLREFGLFGRIGIDNYMIDYVRHPVINKGPDDTLVRTIRLVF